MNGTQIAIIAALNVTAIAFFYIGKLHERVEWNDLINRGIIPAPRKKS